MPGRVRIADCRVFFLQALVLALVLTTGACTHKAPDYVTRTYHESNAWRIPVLAGLVPVQDNRERLADEHPAVGRMLRLHASMAGSQESGAVGGEQLAGLYMAPRRPGLLVWYMSAGPRPGLCAAMTKAREADSKLEVRSLVLAGKPWVRSRLTTDGVDNVSYDRCADDMLWSVFATIPPGEPADELLERMEATIAESRFETTSSP